MKTQNYIRLGAIIYLLLLQNFSLFAQGDCGEGCFVTVWKTDNQGVTANNQILFPGYGEDYDIYWEEVENPSNKGSLKGDSTTTITFPKVGNYRISISPKENRFHRISLSGKNDNLKLLEVKQWGDIAWSSFNAAFMGCKNFVVSALDAPDLSNVSDMSKMFLNAQSFNQPIGDWDVSNVKNMSEMFVEATLFNQSIGAWDVSNVTNMSYMFSEAASFNQPIGGWDVSNVSNISGMFQLAISFNQSIEDWDVSKVTDMSAMFYGTPSFNQQIGDWKVNNVSDMNGMFLGATSFNQPIEKWNISNVTDISGMFLGATSFNQPIEDWEVSNVENMSAMFLGATSFNKPLGKWNVGKVTNTISMFEEATSFNQPLENWDVSNVTDMRWMFNNASSFNQSIGNWKLNDEVLLDLLLSNSGLDCQNYNRTLIGWTSNPLTPANLSLGAEGIKYGAEGVEARNQLLSRGWTITDDGLDEDCKSIITSISNRSKSDLLSVYPNPNQGSFTIEIFGENKNATLEIINVLGQKVFSQELKNLNGKQTIPADLRNHGKGIYWINLYFNNEVINRRIVIQ
ncbi:MAG TPA: BspA family leucine-rich repeat surface protein [Chitinophagales bacterium]|nr:BspA family leucine-rich repeat surface protein [Chitinophagales bacterium]